MIPRMKQLDTSPKLVERVHAAVLAEITSGNLAPGERIIQEQIAQRLGVSRQPVQQALLLLRNQRVLSDAPGRGLLVSALDLDYVRNMYDMRAVIEGLAFRQAALGNTARAAKEGKAHVQAGQKAVAKCSVPDMIAADMAFHQFVYELSGNPLIAPAMDSHWIQAQRVMGEVLIRDDQPRNIWDQHKVLLECVTDGDGDRAEQLARTHILEAADFMLSRLGG